jgi:hypothetical protein
MYSSEMLDSEPDDNSLLNLLGKHFVSIYYTYCDGSNKPEFGTISAFVIVIDGTYWLVTAGHATKEIEKHSENGIQFENFSLMDQFGGGGYVKPVPIDFDITRIIHFYSDRNPSGADFAFYPLHSLSFRTLKANGIVALNLLTDYKKYVDRPYDRMVMLGVPTETVLVDRESKTVNSKLLLVPISNLSEDQVDIRLRSQNYRRIYGEICGDLAHEVGVLSIEGTSGGPVFGIWLSDDKSQFEYCAIGIQSGWLASVKQVAACPLDGFAAELSWQLSPNLPQVLI